MFWIVAALIGVGGWAALSGTGTGLGDLVTFFFLADLFFSPITIIGTQLSEATLAMAGAERYFRLLDTPPAWTDKATAGECPPLKGHVEFRDVRFAYVPDRPVLRVLVAGLCVRLSTRRATARTTTATSPPAC